MHKRFDLPGSMNKQTARVQFWCRQAVGGNRDDSMKRGGSFFQSVDVDDLPGFSEPFIPVRRPGWELNDIAA